MTTPISLGKPFSARQCREIDGPGPAITTLGLLLFDKVTLDKDLVIDIFIQLCDLLGETHQAGYAAGSLHPEGIVLLMDGNQLRSAHIKRSGAYCNMAFTDEISLSFDKSSYLSPEQLDGLAPAPCSDVYALGSMMYTALYGAPPGLKERNTLKLKTLKFERKPKHSANETRRQLDAVIRTCLEDDETRRYRSSTLLKEDLLRIKNGLTPIKTATRKTFSSKAKAPEKLTAAISMCLLFWLVSFTAMQGQSHPALQGIWNKSADQYAYGDRFSITLSAAQPCYAYLVYLDEYDKCMSLFPARDEENNHLASGFHLDIDNIDNHCMKVDTTPGRLVLVSIADGARGREIRQKFLKSTDWESNRALKLSGQQLIKRLETMRAIDPGIVHYSVEDAPRAKEKPKPLELRFSKPSRYEISIRINDREFKLP